MSNVGIFGFPPDPGLDQLAPITLGPMWRDPTLRINWPANIIAINATTGESTLSDLSPSGSATPCFLEWNFWCRAGVYQPWMRMPVFNVYGINELFLDGMSMGVVDYYSATSLTSLFYSTKQVPLGEGMHTVRLQKTGTKNASSTDYYCSVADIIVRRVG